jgi:hypothetical protein
MKKKCISKFGCEKRFEMEHVNNKVLHILSQQEGVENWLRTW